MVTVMKRLVSMFTVTDLQMVIVSTCAGLIASKLLGDENGLICQMSVLIPYCVNKFKTTRRNNEGND